MAISKWGSRFDEAMQEPALVELSVSQQISKVAEQAEILETCRLLGEWFTRKSRSFKGCDVEVLYDYPMAWYEVTISYPFKEKGRSTVTHRAFAQIREEDVVTNTVNTDKWRRFLDLRWTAMRESLTNSMRAVGHSTEQGSGWYEATGRRPSMSYEIVLLPWGKKAPGVHMKWGIAEPVSKDDEEAAIESIKEAMGHGTGNSPDTD